MVILVAGSVAARHGCIFKMATIVEIARKTSHLVFDKPGTLTLGQLTVAVEVYFESEPLVAAAVYALVSNIKHPVSLAIKKCFEGKITSEQKVSDVTFHTGKGVKGTLNGKIIRAGNLRWLGLDDHPVVKGFLLLIDATFCTIIDAENQDSLGLDVKQTVEELQRRSIEVSLVSGDDEGPVSFLLSRAGLASPESTLNEALQISCNS